MSSFVWSMERLGEFRALPTPSKRYAYGTAGFRDRYSAELHGLFFKVGLLAALRSLSVDGRAIGVMITASHNPLEDNGVKLIDPAGEMLSQEWEPLAEAIANAPTAEDCKTIMDAWALTHAIPLSTKCTPLIVVGMDMRWHSPVLSDYVLKGISAFDPHARVIHLGEVTTPVVHFVVSDINAHDMCPTDPSPTHPLPTAMALKTRYYHTLRQGFDRLILTSDMGISGSSLASLRVILDNACGVSSRTIREFLSASAHVADMTSATAPPEECAQSVLSLTPWEIEMRNEHGQGEVNKSCGAEHVQKNQLPPARLADSSVNPDAHSLLCSFDGDGDRIVFHYFDEHKQWTLLDGDRIAVLIADFLFAEMRCAGLLGISDSESTDGLATGLVQTAYANGGAAAYLREQQVDVRMAKTGVKYVHHEAQALDVGVYFEANGHGTVLFSERFHEKLSNRIREMEANPQNTDARAKLAIERLQASLLVVNQTVGDALSDMLFVLAILYIRDWHWSHWRQLYAELPSKQVKCSVKDKSLLRCSADETRLIEPVALQSQIDEAVKSVRQGRCFVRPSGTEDVVRIYAEAETVDEAERLTQRVVEAIHQFFA